MTLIDRLATLVLHQKLSKLKISQIAQFRTVITKTNPYPMPVPKYQYCSKLIKLYWRWFQINTKYLSWPMCDSLHLERCYIHWYNLVIKFFCESTPRFEKTALSPLGIVLQGVLNESILTKSIDMCGEFVFLGITHHVIWHTAHHQCIIFLKIESICVEINLDVILRMSTLCIYTCCVVLM